MSYTPKAAPPPDWLSPKEAVELIRESGRYSDSKAANQLQIAIRADDIAIALMNLWKAYEEARAPIPWEFTKSQEDFASWLLQFVSGAEFSEDSQRIRFDTFKDGQRVEGPWLDFRIWYKDLLKYWKPLPTRVANEKACKKWLIEELKKPDVLNKGDYRQQAKGLFGVAKHRFNDPIWPEAIEEAGVGDKASRPGPKPKAP
jgi:hypothetical protein